jgi:hypothetical protein
MAFGRTSEYEIFYNTENHTYSAWRMHDKSGKRLDRAVRLTPELSKYEDARRELMEHASLR